MEASESIVNPSEISLRELLGDDLYVQFMPEGELLESVSSVPLPIPPINNDTESYMRPSTSNCNLSSEEREQIEKFKAKNINANTSKTTRTWVNVFNKWRASRNIHQPLHEIPEDELDGILQLFYAQVEKANGQD